MARFRYRLQSVLNIKEKMEEQAKQDFSTARMLLEQEEEKLKMLKARKREYEQRARELLSGVLNVQEIEVNKSAMMIMDGYIADQRIEVNRAVQRLETARERMTEAMKERKTQEILREKAFEQFMREENSAEIKMIDELTSYTYGQKQEV